jgi:hypothetical protein
MVQRLGQIRPRPNAIALGEKVFPADRNHAIAKTRADCIQLHRCREYVEST